jgi:hypothetical protein
MPCNIFPVSISWYVKLSFHVLGPARFVELKVLIAAVIYAENWVAYSFATSTETRRLYIERFLDDACITFSLGRIKTNSVEYGVE